MEIDYREDLCSVGYVPHGGKCADGGAAGENKGRGSKKGRSSGMGKIREESDIELLA